MPRRTSLPFWERHPILKQIYDDASKLSKQQIILPSVMTVATFITTLLLGESVSWWLIFRSTALSLAVGFGLYLLLAVLRAPFIVIGRHHRQIANLDQQLREINVTHDPKESLWKPVIERAGARIINRPVNKESNIISETGIPDFDLDPGYINVNVVLARFHHKVADLGRASYVYVKGHIYIRDAVGTPLADYDAVWWPREDGRSCTLPVGDRTELVLALIQSKPSGQLFGYEYHTKPSKTEFFGGEELAPIAELIKGDMVQITVELVLHFGSRVFDQKRFDYRLTLKPKPGIEEN